MINNYNANYDTPENSYLLNKIARIQGIKDKYYLPNNIQPEIFRHSLLFGQIPDGQGNGRQPYGVKLGNASGGARSGGARVMPSKNELIYLDDENERQLLGNTPFLGKRGEPKMIGGSTKFIKGVPTPKYLEANHETTPVSTGGKKPKAKPAPKKKPKSAPKKKATSIIKKLTGEFSILNKVI